MQSIERIVSSQEGKKWFSNEEQRTVKEIVSSTAVLTPVLSEIPDQADIDSRIRLLEEIRRQIISQILQLEQLGSLRAHWIGVEEMVREGGDRVCIEVLHATESEIKEDMLSMREDRLSASDLEETRLHYHLIASRDPLNGRLPHLAAFIDIPVSNDEESVRVLERFAALGDCALTGIVLEASEDLFS